MRRLLWRLVARRLRVTASCPHGKFVPGHYVLADDTTTSWGCEHCRFGFQVRVVD